MVAQACPQRALKRSLNQTELASTKVRAPLAADRKPLRLLRVAALFGGDGGDGGEGGCFPSFSFSNPSRPRLAPRAGFPGRARPPEKARRRIRNLCLLRVVTLFLGLLRVANLGSDLKNDKLAK